jgi:hypothetical protein
MIFSMCSTRSKSKHLEDRVVLAVDRQQRRAARRDLLHQEDRRRRPAPPCWRAPRSARAADRRQRRRQAGGADDPGHDPVGRPLGRLDQRLGPAATSMLVPASAAFSG